MDALARSGLIGDAGVKTSLYETGLQWDAPNWCAHDAHAARSPLPAGALLSPPAPPLCSWAPVQDILVEGLNATGSPRAAKLARGIAIRWLVRPPPLPIPAPRPLPARLVLLSEPAASVCLSPRTAALQLPGLEAQQLLRDARKVPRGAGRRARGRGRVPAAGEPRGPAPPIDPCCAHVTPARADRVRVDERRRPLLPGALRRRFLRRTGSLLRAIAWGRPGVATLRPGGAGPHAAAPAAAVPLRLLPRAG